MPARKRSRKPARRAAPKPARKPARKAAAKPARKAAPKPARKATPKPARKATPRPAPKKPARSLKPKRTAARTLKPKRAPKPRRRERGVATLPIPPAKTRAPAKRRPARKPSEVPPPIVIEDAAAAPQTPAEIADGEQDSRRYVAVVSEIEGGEAFPAQPEAPLFPTRQERRDEVESYPTDIPIALAAALLIASVFLPWYKGDGIALSISGWTSGTLAPLLAFLGAGSIVLVILRRAGSSVSLPVEESLAHEAVGWVALVAAVVKSRWRPSLLGIDTLTSYGVFIAIGAAVVLVVLAGRMSPRAPLVVQPGWHRARGGTIGLALLLVVVGGSAAFGVVNSVERPTPKSNPSLFPGAVQGKLPDCAKDVPLPADLKPEVGYDIAASCQAQLTSKKASADLIAATKKSLTNAGWTFTELRLVQGSAQLQITRPRCAVITIVPASSGSVLAFGHSRCPTVTPSPSPSATTP